MSQGEIKVLLTAYGLSIGVWARKEGLLYTHFLNPDLDTDKWYGDIEHVFSIAMMSTSDPEFLERLEKFKHKIENAPGIERKILLAHDRDIIDLEKG